MTQDSGITTHHIKGFRQSLETMQRLGFSAEECLRGTGLSEADLDKSVSRWDQELIFNRNLLSLAGDPSFGLVLATSFPMPAYGLFGYALLTAPTFRHALLIFESYGDLTYTVCNFRLAVDGASASLVLRPKIPMPDDIGNMLVDRDAACCAFLFTQILAVEPFLDEVTFTHSGHGKAENYQQRFHCPAVFDAPLCQLRFATSWLDRPLPKRDFSATRTISQQCEIMLARYAKRGGVTEGVRQRILNSPGYCFPDIDAVAVSLNMSVRTLRRRLEAEGGNFRDIIGGIRFELAKDYLSKSRLSLEVIASLMGYHDAAALCHAFKRWSHGISPGEWRKSQARAS